MYLDLRFVSLCLNFIRVSINDPFLTSLELEVVLKRRCLAAGGVENHNPEEQAGPVRSPARSRRVESEVKPDTPAIASVRLRVQQLTQRRDGEGRGLYLPFATLSSE